VGNTVKDIAVGAGWLADWLPGWLAILLRLIKILLFNPVVWPKKE